MKKLQPYRFIVLLLGCVLFLTLSSGIKLVNEELKVEKGNHAAELSDRSTLLNATLTNPVNGATNVPVNSSISWTPVDGISAYIINIGTTPGGNDVVSNQTVGLATTFTPPLGLPENSTIYVTITLFNFESDDIVCPEESFSTEDVTTPPPCIFLSSPMNGETEVPVGALLSWSPAVSAEGYRITVGTSPGGTDIVNMADIGNVLSYKPPGNLPASTLIYVSIVPYNSNGDALGCSEESFTTAEASVLPACTALISPMNGDSGVPLSAVLTWAPVGNATGYRVTVGSTPFDDDILTNADLGNVTSLSFLNFIPNSFIYVTITPYNDAGAAISCNTESFSTVLGCGPFLDPDSGELIFFGPDLSFPDMIGLCLDELPQSLRATEGADGYRWFSIANDGSELLVSSEITFDIFNEGQYRVEAFNLVEGGTLECTAEQEFSVVASEAPTVTSIDIQSTPSGTEVTVVISGSGDYEFALNNSNGPYQDSPTFIIDPAESNRVYIRDRNGCGIIERFINSGLPNFFTPNGDSFNDFWQIPGAMLDGEAVVAITIFDRFGKLLKRLDPLSQGWDGNYVGNPMPASDYWYRVQLQSGRIFTGHFALKR